jgi:sugar O-acyltransferase (sialic acid O-acetyltransferase NeuD family)
MLDTQLSNHSTEVTDVNELFILGAGGHAKVVVETAFLCGFRPVAVYDDDEKLAGTNVLGVKVEGKISDLPENFARPAFIAIGNNEVRRKLTRKFPLAKWQTLIHPSAVISRHFKIGDGTIICAGAVIQADARIGGQVIVNTGANIDHDCVLGDFVHVCPGGNLAGGVRIGEGCLIGIGSSIIPLKSIGAWSILGAGSVVIDDISAGSRAWGVPARIIDNHE